TSLKLTPGVSTAILTLRAGGAACSAVPSRRPSATRAGNADFHGCGRMIPPGNSTLSVQESSHQEVAAGGERKRQIFCYEQRLSRARARKPARRGMTGMAKARVSVRRAG